MYKVTYLERNGFIVESDEVILVFDMHSDPSHALHHALSKSPDKPVIFLVTSYGEIGHHGHSIYELAQNHKRTYVMSNDVLPQNAPDTLAIAGMSAGDTVENLSGDVRVHAFATGEKGEIAFLVTDGKGKRIFHAGELDSGVAVDRIAAEIDSLDLAFLECPKSNPGSQTPLFIEKVKVHYVVPMHCDCNGKAEAGCGRNGACEVNKVILNHPGDSADLNL